MSPEEGPCLSTPLIPVVPMYASGWTARGEETLSSWGVQFA